MSISIIHLKQSARWLLLAAALGSLSAFAAQQTDPQREMQLRDREYYDVVAGDVYSGRSPFFKSNKAQPMTLAQAKPTVVITAPVAGAPPPSSPANCSSANTGLIQVSETMPAEVSLGDSFTYQIVVNPVACVGNVVVVDMIPDGTTLVSTDPQASVSGSQLTWNLGNLDVGATQTLKVTVKANKEGSLVSCATVKADPRVCAKTFVGRPQLAIDKSGPEVAQLGTDVAYTIVVKNVGTAVAKGVVVNDTVPAGLGGPREIPFTVGDLAPGASKTIPVLLKATERGKFCNVAVATAANAPSVKDDACTTVVRHLLKIFKTGPAEAYYNKQAVYKIVVDNQGDTEQTGVVVTDTAPPQTRIVNASGATVVGNVATWNIPSIKAGEKKELSVTLTSAQTGKFCNVASVTSAQGQRDSSEACTLWKGVAGILLEYVDDPDPIQIGEQCHYTIRITNQGLTDLTNVGMVVTSDTEIDPVSSPDGTISGKKVTFPNVPVLGAKKSITYTYVGKGVSAGQSYNKAVLTCSEMKLPIEDTEVTSVY